MEGQSPARRAFLDFGESTTIHSISRQISPKPVIRRVIWCCLFFSSLVYAMYQCQESISTYLRAPLNINTTWKIENYLPLPAFTVCNLNAIRKSAVENTKFYKDIDKKFMESMKKRELLPGLKGLMQKMTYNFSRKLNESEVIQIGHNRSNFILGCNYNSTSCKNSLQLLPTSSFGNCFTFNAGENRKPLVAHKAGKSEALELVLNVETDEYIGPLSPDVGVVVVIHDPDVRPYPYDDGMVISPGFTTDFAITKKTVERLPKPAQKLRCKSRDTKTIFKNKLYTVSACVKECIAIESYKKCKCIPPDMRSTESCDPFNTTQMICVEKVKRHLDNNLETICQCLPRCNEDYYGVSKSSANWPSVANWNYLKYMLVNTSAQNMSTDFRAARENLVRVRLFYSSFTVMHEREEESYEFSNLLGDVGGQFGLCVGMSILSLCEVFELFYDILIIVFNHLVKAKMTSQVGQQPS